LVCRNAGNKDGEPDRGNKKAHRCYRNGAPERGILV
jgi:hypothetical protein